MKLTPDDIPCLVKAKYICLPKKRIASLTNAEDVDECFYDIGYEEILIGGGDANSKLEFNLARFSSIKHLEFTTMPDGDFYFQKFKNKDDATIYHLVKINSIISRIPQAPNCIHALMKYSFEELQEDITRWRKLDDSRRSHKLLAYEIMSWYFNFMYDRKQLSNKFEWISDCCESVYVDEEGDEISNYPNLIAEIQGYD